MLFIAGGHATGLIKIENAIDEGLVCIIMMRSILRSLPRSRARVYFKVGQSIVYMAVLGRYIVTACDL